MRYRLSLPCLLFAAGCLPSLDVPADAQLICDSDLDCPPGHSCRADECVDDSRNEPPTLTLGVIARGLDQVLIPVTVIDLEGDPVTVDAEVSVAGSDFSPIDLAAATDLAATPEGLSADLLWETAATDLGDLGHQGFVEDIELKLRPRDADSGGIALVSDAFTFGNDAPTVLNVTLDTLVIGNAVVRFEVSDFAADAVRLSAFELSTTGLDADYQAVAVDAVNFPAGALTGIPSSRTGEPHTLTWASHLIDTGDVPFGAKVRVEVTDDHDAASGYSASNPFQIDNGSTPSTVALTPITDLGTTLTGPLQLTYVVSDPDCDVYAAPQDCPRVSVYVDWCLQEGGVTCATDGVDEWNLALSSSPTVNLIPESSYSYEWDIFQLSPAIHPEVFLRFTPLDGEIGAPALLGPFAADTRSGGSVDSSPPDYLSPSDGSLFTSQTITLQWTSRLGATEYTVEVATDPTFPAPSIVSTITTANTVATVIFTDDLTYYWRVKSDVSVPPNEWSNIAGQPIGFSRLGDTIYVFCPETDTTDCSDVGRVGNRSDPLQSIQRAIATAAAYGITQVKVATRGGGETYIGVIALDGGVDLLGGYDDTFAEEPVRDPVANPTILSGAGIFGLGSVVILSEGLDAPTLVDGFQVRGDLGAESTYGVVSAFGTAPLTLARLDVVASDAVTASFGLRCESSSVVALAGSRFAGGMGWESSGISARSGCSLDLDGVTATGGDAFTSSYGLAVWQAAVTVNDGVFNGGAAMTSVGLVGEGASVSVTGATITAGGAADNSYGVWFNAMDTIDLNDVNAAGSAAGSESIGGYFTFGADIVVQSSSFSGGDGLLSFGLKARDCGTMALTDVSGRALSSTNADISVGVFLAQIADATLTGITAAGGPANTGMDSIGLQLDTVASVVIADATLSAGDGNFLAIGLFSDLSTFTLTCGAAPVVGGASLWIYGGDPPISTSGPVHVNGGTGIIDGCVISGFPGQYAHVVVRSDANLTLLNSRLETIGGQVTWGVESRTAASNTDAVTVTIADSTLTGASTPVGLHNDNLSLVRSVVVSSDPVNGNAVLLMSDGQDSSRSVEIRDSALYSPARNAVNLNYPPTNFTSTLVIEGNTIIAAGTATDAEAVLDYIEGGQFDRNIVMVANGTSSICYDEPFNVPLQWKTSFDANVLTDCVTLYDDGTGGSNPMTDVCDTPVVGNVGNSGCTIVLAPSATNTVAATSAQVFEPGFDSADPSTWIRTPNGAADIDSDGSFDDIDAGADVTAIGSSL